MTVLFDGKFTTAWLSRNGVISNWKYSCIVASNRFQSLPSYLGRTNVGKFTILDGDACNTYNGDERNMVQTWGHAGLTLGNTIWIGFSFMQDASWTDSGTWNLLWQFGTPAETLTIYSSPNQLGVGHKSLNVNNRVGTTLIKGSWYDVVIQLKLSTGSDGYYEVWLRPPGGSFSVVYSSFGATVLNTEGSTGGLDHAVAIYRGATATSTQIMYFSDYKVGTTRADVEYAFVPPEPFWQCEIPLNGYEYDGLGNRRLNPDCNPVEPFWQCEIPLNGYEYDGLGNRRLNPDCDPVVIPTPVWQCEMPLNGYENDGLGNRRLNSDCNPIITEPFWQCEIPLNGYEYDGLGNRRLNPSCNATIQEDVLYPSSPYSIEGTIKINGTIQPLLTVTIQNLTKTVSNTCTTDSQGRYLYDNIQDNYIRAEYGDSIRVCTPTSGTSSVTFVSGVSEEKVVDMDYILHPHPSFPFSIEGIVIYYDVIQEDLTVTIRNLTKGTSGTCFTDVDGHYLYDDIQDDIILGEYGDIINAGTPDGATESFIFGEE